MTLLGGLSGGNTGRQQGYRSSGRFQGAVAGAGNVMAKPTGQSRIDINALRNLQARKKSGVDNYKLNANGKSRFRLVMPIGNDVIPLVSANRHWLPGMTDDGKEIKRPIYCYEQFDLPCPICALQNLLAKSSDQSLKADAEVLRANNMWAAYVIDRDYLANAQDLSHFDPKQDKVVLFGNLAPKIADMIINYLESGVWGDATDPDYGYDFLAEGTPSGKVFNGYKVSDYTISPFPREFSPAYNPNLLTHIKPLSEVVAYSRVDDLRKLFDPILSTLSQTEAGQNIVMEFSDMYKAMLEKINAGPEAQEEYVEEEPMYGDEMEHINVQGGEAGYDTNAESEAGQSGKGNSANPNNSATGKPEDVYGKGGQADSNESEQVSDGGVINPEPFTDEPFVDTPVEGSGDGDTPSLISSLQNIGRKK